MEFFDVSLDAFSKHVLSECIGNHTCIITAHLCACRCLPDDGDDDDGVLDHRLRVGA